MEINTLKVYNYPKLRIGLCYERKYGKIVVKHVIFYPQMQFNLH